MSNRGFERSMNGINDIEVNEVQFPDGSTISSASNLVQLDTNNNFTAFNTYNENLPTSTKTPESDNQFTTKSYVDNQDANDYPTAFTRNGTTGDITLTTANTGVPLSGDTTITSITNAEILQIATNTGDIEDNTLAITGLTTATNECFDDVAINGNDLTFSRVDDENPKTITTDFVDKSNDQTIGGIKTFSSVPICSTEPTTDNELANRSYVLTQIPDTADFVDRTTDQTIGGVKTFSDVPICSTEPTTNDELVNRYYALSTFVNIADNYQTITGNKTFSNGIKVQSINAIGSDGVIVKNNSGSGGFSVNNSGYVEITDRLSIGTGGSPLIPLEVRGYAGSMSDVQRSYFTSYMTGLARNDGGFTEIGIYSQYHIITGGFFVAHSGTLSSSDIRIKKDVKTIDEVEALEKIRKIRPVNYKYIDERIHGNKTQTGFIAQEINEVLPTSIKLMEKSIPNIYECVKVSDTYTITFPKSTPLKVGDGLEFYGLNNVGRPTTITEVINDTTIKIKDDFSNELCDMSGNKGGDCLFCYGEVVKDYQHLKYNDVFTTLFSAVKLMDKRITELEQKLNM